MADDKKSGSGLLVALLVILLIGGIAFIVVKKTGSNLKSPPPLPATDPLINSGLDDSAQSWLSKLVSGQSASNQAALDLARQQAAAQKTNALIGAFGNVLPGVLGLFGRGAKGGNDLKSNWGSPSTGETDKGVLNFWGDTNEPGETVTDWRTGTEYEGWTEAKSAGDLWGSDVITGEYYDDGFFDDYLKRHKSDPIFDRDSGKWI